MRGRQRDHLAKELDRLAEIRHKGQQAQLREEWILHYQRLGAAYESLAADCQQRADALRREGQG